MKKYKRKLQFVAGSTYSISLPKEWVRAFNLKPQQELELVDVGNGLVITPEGINLCSNETSICVDNSVNSISKMFMFSYYYGFETVNFYSRSEMSSDVKSSIRSTISELPGVEIIYEDKKKISVKIMFDSLNIDLFQIFYRISLLIESSIENIVGELDVGEIKLNEGSVDRLYHLVVKIITMSIKNRGVLASSKINDSAYIPSLLLVGKRLENIADNLNHIAGLIEGGLNIDSIVSDIFSKIYIELNRSILYLMGRRKKEFVSMTDEEFDMLKGEIKKIKDGPVKQFVKEILRYVWNIHEEVVSINFYNKLK